MRMRLSNSCCFGRLCQFFFLFISILFSLPAISQEKPAALPGGEHWYNGDRAETIWFADDQIFLLNQQSLDTESFAAAADSAIPNATVVDSNSNGSLVTLPTGVTATELLSATGTTTRDSNVRFAAVYRTSASDQSAVAIKNGEMVLFPAEGTSIEELDAVVEQNANGEKRLQVLMDGKAAIYTCPTDRSCLKLCNDLRKSSTVLYAYPNFIRSRPTRGSGNKQNRRPGQSPGAGTRFNVNDPLFADQWHLENSGQSGGLPGEDVNIQEAWDRNLSGGSNYHVFTAIVDDGLEIDHEDIIDNQVAGAHLDLVDLDSDPSPGTFDNHGTAVAGVASAYGFNSLGVSGAAPLGGLVGIRLLGVGTTDSDEATALAYLLTDPFLYIDTYNNSWGPPDSGQLAMPGPLAQVAMANGVQDGRNGDGAIYVWAGGNGLANDDNANYDGYANSRYTIAVGASGDDGVQSEYSEPGANLLVNAPSSNTNAGITTTDRSGASGYSPDDYTSNFGGTSSAAPLVAGVVALMLDANPDLGWRDVQKLLAITAQRNDPTDPDWVQNGAGHWVNHKYGFGRVDAGAATAEALAWTWTGHASYPEISTTEAIFPGAPIPQPEVTGASLELTISVTDAIEIQHVYLTIDSDHTYWGDLEIILTSPEGTESVLTQSHLSGGGPQLSGGFRFSTMRLLGESSVGDWTIDITDQFSGDTGSILSAELQIFGTPAVVGATCNGSPVTVFMEFGDVPTSGDDVILGTDGADIINAQGGNDTICAGDGNDTINGGRGDDWIDAGAGNDTVLGARDDDLIFGGTGNDDIQGGPDDDIIYGQEDDDILLGNSGADLIDGGEGVDSIKGGSGDDIIMTGSGATVGTGLLADGGSGNDLMYGGPDADVIRGSTDQDRVEGNGGNDQLYGGGGDDIVYGSDGDDLIRGNAGNDTLYGGPGDDDINGYGSKDLIFGGPGNDTLSGSTGNDQIYGEGDNDIINGGGGNDNLYGGSGDDDITGGGSDDHMDGGDGTIDSCDGQSGTDTADASCEVVIGVP